VKRLRPRRRRHATSAYTARTTATGNGESSTQPGIHASLPKHRFTQFFSSRDEPAAEAISLGHAPTDLLPDDPEIRGLLALMLLHYSRRQARFRDGELMLPTEQGRSR
jgi:uncharacterized protein DUF6596